MNFCEGFKQYVGIPGVLAVIVGVGYVYAMIAGIELPAEYVTVLNMLIGVFVGKNGNNAATAVKKKLSK